MRKRIAYVSAVLICLLVFTACGQKQESSAPAEQAVEEAVEEQEKTAAEEPAEETQAEAVGEAPAEAAEEASTEEASTEEAEENPEAGETAEGMTQIANPWSEFDSAEEAAQNAGIEALSIDVSEIRLGAMTPYTFRSMDSLEETIVEFPAVEMTIRKGTGFEDGDCSGVYTEYLHEWTRDVNGLEVKCFGNREGDSTKTIWNSEDYSYCIFVEGLGGDEDFGLDGETIDLLVSGIQ